MLFLQTFLLLVISSLVVFGQHTFSSGSSTYTLIEQQKTWEAAKSYAEGQGGQLLEIDSATEMEVVQNALESYFAGMSSAQRTAFLNATRAPDGGGAAYLWLGGSDAASEGEWRWVSTDQQFWSGEYYNGNSVGGAYHNWGTVGGVIQEPDNYQNQDALALGLEAWPYGAPSSYRLGTAYQWNDIDLNSNQLYFIIEKDLVNPGIEPPASIAGLQVQVNYTTSSDVITSVPYQDYFGSDGIVRAGFSGSILERFPYTYANGVITYPSWDEEVRLSFESSTSGTWESWEYHDGNYSLDDSGTFTVVSPSLVEKTDWQRTETLDDPLSDQYWNVWRRSVDALAYDDGELSFIFAAGGNSDPDTEIQYGRTLPMDENWQVVLEDMYAAPGLSGFNVELELEIADPEFQCELYFADYGYGYGREFGVFLEQQLPSGDWEYAQAYITANEDTRISSGGNVRIVHIASSRDLIFEYQPDGASEWSELARLNLESGSFQGENAYGSLPGGILSATGPRMTVEIEAKVQPGVATQIADLEIAGIEIGSYTYTPPPASIAGKELNHGDGVLYFDSQGVYYGGVQNAYINQKGPWAYHVSGYKGILTLDDLTDTLGGYRVEVELSFSSPTAGSYEVFEVDGVRPEQPNFTGNFTLGARTLLGSVHPDWQYREDFEGTSLDDSLWSPYTDSGRDELTVSNGLLSVLIDSQALESDTWAGADSLRLLPMSESWEVQTRVVADVNRLAGVNDYEIGIILYNYNEVASGGFEINLEDWGLGAGVINRTSPWDAFRYAHTNALPSLASAHLRIVHDSNTSIVSLAYDVDGATNGWNWEPLIEYQLSDGSGTRWINGVPEPFSGGTWTLGQDDYLRVDLEAHVSGTNGAYDAQPGDLGFDYFEISSYTPPPAWELYDDFSSGSLDLEKWETTYWPGGQTPVVTDGQLRLVNGGGSGRKDPVFFEDPAFLSALQSAGFDLSTATYHSGVVFTDPTIIGVEADLFLPADVTVDSGIFIEFFEKVGPSEIRLAGTDLAYWGDGQAELGFEINSYSNLGKVEEYDTEQYVTLGQSYRVRIVRDGGEIKFYHDDQLVHTHRAEGELLAIAVMAFNDSGNSMYATIDNVRVLRSALNTVESYGEVALLEGDSGYYAGDSALIYEGSQLSASSYAGYVVVGVDLYNGNYRLIRTNGSRYYAANFSLTGTNTSKWSRITNLEAEELNLQQDLDGDGYVGIAPPASIAGKAYQFSMGGDVITSVPLQLEFDSMTYNEGFAGSLIDANRPYTYADGVIYFSEGDELRLSFESSTSGTWELWELWELEGGGYSLDDSGTFTVVSPSLVEKTDWQRTETLDDPLSDQYWNVWRRSVDALAYDDGELSFIFAAGGDSDPETEIEYGRTLPMDENWQVVLEDMYAAPGLSGFSVELELEIADPEFACELYFADYGYGYGREFGVFLEQQLPSGDWEYAQAYITANEDTRISSGGNVRIVHIASSRDLIFEYQPDGASEWSELARLNLESGSFQGENLYGSLTGGILSATGPRMTVEIEAEVQPGVATQIADLEIAGIEIGSYTPPPASIAGKGYRITYTDGDLTSVPVDAIFAADSFNYGFSGNLIGSYNYSYEDGVLIWDEEEQVVFNFSSASGGTFQQGYIDEFDGFYVESRGTFKESNIKLSLQTNWPRTETMNKALSSKYWTIETEHSADRVAYDDGELNFIFADDSESSDESEWSDESHREIELLYAGALPLSEDWQIVVDDTYVSDSVQEFAMGYSLAQEGVFDCEFGFGSGYEGVREVYFYTDDGDEDSYNYAYVSSTDDPRIQNGISFRIRHDSSSRELIYAYQPDGADDWTELARINLGSGAVSGSKVDGSGLTGPLPSRDQHLFFMVDMDNYATDYQATQIGDLEIGGIQISKGDWKSLLKVSVSLANGITGDGDATVLIDGVSETVSLVRGKGTVKVAMPTGSTYTVSASMGALTSGTAKSVLLNKAKTLSLILDGDSDGDGLSDSQEARYKGDRNNADTDGDGISDGEEVYFYKTKVDLADSDKDGLSDYEELNTYFTNPLKADSDGDRMSDYAELEAGTDPTDKSEYPAYLKVQVSLAKGISADGDATVLIDGVSETVSLVRGKGTVKVAMPTGSTYTVSASMGALTSGTAKSVLLNKAKTLSLILDGDSDGDGLSDSQEARYKGDRNNADTDGDGISDGEEVYFYKTKVDLADSDKDGLSDYEELNTYFTNPLKADSDGDRMSDYAEIEAGTDPNDKSVYPAYLKVQVSLAKGITGDGDATVLIDADPYAVSLVRGKGTLQVAMPTGSSYTVSASLDALTSGDPRSVLMNKAATVSLVLDGDSDGDGLPDSLEARYKGDPNLADTDGDGILDGAEVNTYRTRVDVADTDKDGFTDKQELDLSTNPLSSKDKPSAYIERPVVVDWLLRYEAEDGYINEDWSTEQLASFLSAAAGDRQDAASIYLKYSLDGSNVKWIVRHEAEDIDVTSLMRPMKVSKPAQLDAVVMSPEAADGSYYGAELFSLGISAGKTKSLSLVVGGESTFIQLGPNISGLDLDLAVASDYQVLGLMKDPQLSDGPILIEGILKLGDEVANVLGQVIGPVATGDTASTFN